VFGLITIKPDELIIVKMGHWEHHRSSLLA
jgi:hypothetical protein